MLTVCAGDVVDTFIENLIPHLDEGDIIIDGGNTNYPDKNRHVAHCREKGIHFIGTGVSGGEEGARFGPSIMPGGAPEAWEAVKPIFQGISAKTDVGEPCCDWVGNDGAGHFVKMVHNGIEYGEALVEKILDTAGQKGTGKWTGINALDLGIPLTLISESVFSRCLSALKDQRVEAEKLFGKTITPVQGDKKEWIDALRQALLASKIISYAQGFMLMREASNENDWYLNYSNVELIMSVSTVSVANPAS
jgi:6-phosphogluconate dehydrogenase